MWPSATIRIGLLLAILFVLLVLVYLRHIQVSGKEPFVISNDGLIETNQKGVKCPKGSFCPPLSGKAFLCPGGTYGASEGLLTAACSGLCEPGYICDAGSTSKTAKKCPGGFYCIAGTASVGPITPTICPEGYFCPPGSAAPQKCGEMETCPEGTGACPPGNTACGGTTQPGPVSTPTKMGSADQTLALSNAIWNRRKNEALQLIQNGVNVNETTQFSTSRFYGGKNFLVSPLMYTLFTPDKDIVKALIQAGANVNWKNDYDDSILTIAKRMISDSWYFDVRPNLQAIVTLLQQAGAK